MTGKNNELLIQLNQLCDALSPIKSRFEVEVQDIFSLQKDYVEKLQRFSEQEQQLSIGIMGQVKAGKSSFLNALLFDGAPVLPEAATPKTANLTRITYAGTPELIVTYYTHEEWADIIHAGNSDGDGMEVRVAKDLVDTLKQAGIDPSEKLKLGTECINARSVEELMVVMNDFVGNDGRYTALVKMTELRLPLEGMNGFNVVDTPGLNDPVTSRTQKTREYMANCDVVFYLSRCSQFLDSSDVALLASQLPSKGVKRLVLVAAQYDGAILDDGDHRKTLLDTEKNLRPKFNRRAEKIMEELSLVRDKTGQPEMATLLRQIKQPIVSSTYAHAFFSKEIQTLGKGMQHVYNELTELAATHWQSYQFTKGDWQRIANFDVLIAAYQKARSDKKLILDEQRLGLLPHTRQEMKTRLQYLQNVIDARIQNIQHSDLTKIFSQDKKLEQNIHGIASKLSSHFYLAASKAESTYCNLAKELHDNISKFSNIKTVSGTTTRKVSREVSTSSWYKPWTWGDTETVYRTITEDYKYIAASDALDMLTTYIETNAHSLEREFARIINTAELKAVLRKSLLDKLNVEGADFDPKAFRAMLDSALNRLEIPILRIKKDGFAESISRNFNGEVRDDSEMQKLRETLNKTLNKASIDLSNAFKCEVDYLVNQLNFLRDTLSNTLTSAMREEIRQLKSAIENKEKELSLLKKISDVIKELGYGF